MTLIVIDTTTFDNNFFRLVQFRGSDNGAIRKFYSGKEFFLSGKGCQCLFYCTITEQKLILIQLKVTDTHVHIHVLK